MKSCEEIRGAIQARWDDREPGFDAESRAHLAACERCRATLESWEALDRALAAWSAPPAPSDLAGRIARALREAGLVESGSTGGPGVRTLRGPGRRFGIWMGLAAGLAGLAFWLGFRDARNPALTDANPTPPEAGAEGDRLRPLLDLDFSEEDLPLALAAADATFQVVRLTSSPAIRFGMDLLRAAPLQAAAFDEAEGADAAAAEGGAGQDGNPETQRPLRALRALERLRQGGPRGEASVEGVEPAPRRG